MSAMGWFRTVGFDGSVSLDVNAEPLGYTGFGLDQEATYVREVHYYHAASHGAAKCSGAKPRVRRAAGP